jgi:hypothetical protein
MPEIVADRVRAPVVACFSIPESQNLNGLILIRFCLARTREPPQGVIHGGPSWRTQRGRVHAVG